jgi:hypothetical protein
MVVDVEQCRAEHVEDVEVACSDRVPQFVVADILEVNLKLE